LNDPCVLATKEGGRRRSNLLIGVTQTPDIFMGIKSTGVSDVVPRHSVTVNGKISGKLGFASVPKASISEIGICLGPAPCVSNH
jgi:hypothetical protein